MHMLQNGQRRTSYTLPALQQYFISITTSQGVPVLVSDWELVWEGCSALASEHSLLGSAVASVTQCGCQWDEHRGRQNMYMQNSTHTRSTKTQLLALYHNEHRWLIALTDFVICNRHLVVFARERGKSSICNNANLNNYHALQSSKLALQSTSPVTHSWP